MTTTAEQTFCSDALFYNFRRKFWQVTALSWTFSLGKGTEGPEISLGAVPPDPLLEPPLGGLMFSPRVLSNKIEKT